MNESIATGEVYYLIKEKIINCLKLNVSEIAELIDQLDGVVVTHRDGTTATYTAGEMAAMPTGQFAGLLQHLVDANIDGRISSPHREILDELAENVTKGEVDEAIHHIEPVDDQIEVVPSRCVHDEPEPAATEADPLDQLDYEVVCRINEQIDHLVRLGLDDDLSNPYLTLALIADRMGGVLAAVADVIQTNYPVDVGEFDDTAGEITVWTHHPDMDRPMVTSWELSSIDAAFLMDSGCADGNTYIFNRAQLLPLMCSNTSAVPPMMRRIAVGIDPQYQLSGVWLPEDFAVKYRPFTDEDEDGDGDE